MVKLLACFGGGFKCNRRVETIEKKHCFMTQIPHEIYRHSRTLQELKLDSNNIKELPPQFYKLTALRILTLSDNDLTQLSSDITHLSQLVELDLSRNDIPRIPDNVKMLGNLETVDFSANPLTNIPDSLCYLRSLKHLRINAISLERFPDCIGELKSLVQLEARENMISCLPDAICHLESLQQLDLGENEIDSLPVNFGNLTKLRELWLDTNDIKVLPQSIGGLKDLSIADFANNKIEMIPDSIEGCISMTDLTLRQNYLSSLPSSIGKLVNLQVLKVDENKLTELTDMIGECRQLSELVLTENLLQYLPESIGQLGELSVLNIDRNRLSILTNRIGECKSIRVLSLRENVLKEIPASIGDCSNLHVINVSGNQLDWLPDTLLKLDVKAVWLSENQAQPLIKFQHETLVGAGGPKRVLTCFLLPQRAPQYNPNQTQPIADSGPPPDFEKANKIKFEDPERDEEEEDKAEGINIPFDRDNQFRVTPNPGTLEERKRANQERAKEIQENLKKMDSRDNIAAGYQQEVGDVVDEGDDTEEELEPLINGNDESREENEPEDSKVQFVTQDQEPVESRLKRKNTPHYKRDLAIDPNVGNNLLDAIPNLDLSKSPQIITECLSGDGSFGLSIAGGGGSPPYIEGDGSVFISRVVPDGRAEAAGILVGDKLVEINGRNVLNTEHEIVASLLRELRNNKEMAEFTLYRYPLIQGYERIEEFTDDEGDVQVVNQQLNFSQVSSAEIETEIEQLAPSSVSNSSIPPPAPPSASENEEIDHLPTPPSSPPPRYESPSPTPPTQIESPAAISPIPPPLIESRKSVTSTPPLSIPPPSEITDASPSTPLMPDYSHQIDSPPPLQILNAEADHLDQNASSDTRDTTPVKSIQINRDFQSPKPFKSPDTDVASLSFKDKMKLFRESGPSANQNSQNSKKKISLVSSQDIKSIKADESRKLISQSAAELRREKFFDMDNSDDIYKQTADLDSGSAHNEGPPKIQKPTQSIKLPENPLEVFSGGTRDEELKSFEQDFQKSLGGQVEKKDWEIDAQRNREDRQRRLMQFDNDAARATKVLRRERSLKGSNEERVK